MDVLWGLGGMAALLVIAFALSTDRRAIRPRTVFGALGIQLGMGVLVLYWEQGERLLKLASDGVAAVIESSEDGTNFLFGRLLEGEGTIFAFQVLPVVIFVASLAAVLFHLGIMQRVVHGIGGALRIVLGTSHAESMNAAANMFVGQTEAPLFIRPYLARLTRSELFAVMVGGLATVAGTVLVGYSLLGAPLEYLIAASFMAAPGGLLMAKIIMPETGRPELIGPGHDTGARPPAAAGRTGFAAALARLTPGRSGTRTPGGPQEGAGPGEGAGRGGARDADRWSAGRWSEDAPGTDRQSGDDDGGDARRDAAEGDDDRRDDGRPADAGTEEGARAAGGPPGGGGRAASAMAAADEDRPLNVIDAAARGASDGLRLALNIGAMLLAFISLIALLNLLLGTVGGWFGEDDLSFQQLIGYVFAPVMALIGVPWEEAVESGAFVGQKLVLNEFVAFAEFGPQIDQFSEKTATITTFALTGFANFSSLAILLGGLGSLIPHRRGEIAQLGIRAIFAGTLANLMSAAIAGMLVG
ncbi:NupC/NupG family nucleoside CNT transporter [Streptomyces sp. JJ36]|uniref:NupC/NupG family nucleoside CNT transporter n=1 Tax=Streptomyces sp. JJ36 TaxID=2736645 RepID=UPI001F40F6F6|nr:nucleoside transporter C-terminal domain-containing protein [Streptomyces sp. JJ36]MCF6523135.1 NupC/NupG family nucleoside CNT transporter [Streptomyces sp. JJ36]